MTDLLTALLVAPVIYALTIGARRWAEWARRSHDRDACPGCRARDDRPMQP